MSFDDEPPSPRRVYRRLLLLLSALHELLDKRPALQGPREQTQADEALISALAEQKLLSPGSVDILRTMLDSWFAQPVVAQSLYEVILQDLRSLKADPELLLHVVSIRRAFVKGV